MKIENKCVLVKSEQRFCVLFWNFNIDTHSSVLIFFLRGFEGGFAVVVLVDADDGITICPVKDDNELLVCRPGNFVADCGKFLTFMSADVSSKSKIFSLLERSVVS